MKLVRDSRLTGEKILHTYGYNVCRIITEDLLLTLSEREES